MARTSHRESEPTLARPCTAPAAARPASQRRERLLSTCETILEEGTQRGATLVLEGRVQLNVQRPQVPGVFWQSWTPAGHFEPLSHGSSSRLKGLHVAPIGHSARSYPTLVLAVTLALAVQMSTHEFGASGAPPLTQASQYGIAVVISSSVAAGQAEP